MRLMWFDHLETFPAASRPDLVAGPVAAALPYVPDALVVEIDPAYSDTEAMCARYGLPMEASANAVMVSGKREGVARNACCMTLAHRRVDVNNVVKRRLDVRKASFIPMDEAVEISGMEYGGITPVGLPADWPVWVDGAVAETDWVCIGAGLRGAKLLLPGRALLDLPGAVRVDDLCVTKPGP
ncbi:MAG TPA: YbaK/EbsC family protein [Propionibacteriaceae bacterium]|nr:YbaK/EbsC family protein [Propionibacteriaceae bacterium]